MKICLKTDGNAVNARRQACADVEPVSAETLTADGSVDQKLRVQPEDTWDAEQTAAAELAEKHGCKVRYVTGGTIDIVNGAGEVVMQADAMIERGTITVRADSPTKSVSESAEHELAHERLNSLRGSTRESTVGDFIDTVKGSFKEAAWKQIEEAYLRKYEGVNEDLAGDPAKMELAVWEEILCSAYAGINEYGVRASVYQAQAVDALDGAVAEQSDGLKLPEVEKTEKPAAARKQSAADTEGLSLPKVEKVHSTVSKYNAADDLSFNSDNDDDIISPTPSQIKEYNKRLIYEFSGFVHSKNGVRLSNAEKAMIASELKTGNGHLFYGTNKGYLFAGTGFVFNFNPDGSVTATRRIYEEWRTIIEEESENAAIISSRKGVKDSGEAVSSRVHSRRSENDPLSDVNGRTDGRASDISSGKGTDDVGNQERSKQDSGLKKNKFSAADTEGEYLSLAEKYRDGTATEAETEQLRQAVEAAAKKAGYDTPMLYHGTDSFGFTEFDLVTYDDNGEIIPLSERFDAKNTDIRYSAADTEAEKKAAKRYIAVNSTERNI